MFAAFLKEPEPAPAPVFIEITDRIPRTAEILAKENSITLIKARSGNPCRESVGIESRSYRVSSTLKTGVLPRLTT
jgi:hypothetical protein